MNIFKKELKFNRKSLLIWSVFLIIFIAMGMQKYDAMILSGSEEFMEMMNALPSSIQAVFGISTLDLTSIVGYYAILYLYLLLIVSVHAAMIGTRIIDKEEKDKTAEFLMVKPVTRSHIVFNKIMAAFINIFVLNVVSFLTSIIILYVIEDTLLLKDMMLLHSGMFITQMLFLAIGASFALITKKPKKTSSLVMGILLSTFFLSMIIDMESSLKMLSFLTPFKYFDAKHIIPDQSINIYYVGLVVLIIFTSLLIGIKIYKKRDLSL